MYRSFDANNDTIEDQSEAELWLTELNFTWIVNL